MDTTSCLWSLIRAIFVLLRYNAMIVDVHNNVRNKMHQLYNNTIYNKCRHIFSIIYRTKSSLKLWDEEISTEIKLNIEKHWSDAVMHQNPRNHDKNDYYVLPMFPYPSGNLHMGHVRVYSISDTIARLQILSGNNPIHPIGWDAFGLPAENAAIEHGIAPHQWTQTNIDCMKSQLLQLGINFDWSREISTCDPQYYKWTQFIFLKLFERGLAYQTKAQVNWDPVDKTVLADEQVDDQGCSWRSGVKVEKKYLKQWFVKTTKFAKELYDGLDSTDLENWKDIINLQKHWIGQCDGVVVTFKIQINNQCKTFDVWTSEPYKFIHSDFLTISSTHPLVHNLDNKQNISLTGYNPISDCDLPVYITDEVTYPDGRDVYIGCSAFDEDRNIASSLKIPITEQKSSINVEKDSKEAIKIAIDKNVGGYFVSSKLKDWLISRQRYWGTPIPIIHCVNCGVVPVPYEELPIKLPEINSSQHGIQTLEKQDDWVNCKCPKCQSNAKRETDTMDTFVDSSWYYYRFLDPKNDKMPFSKEVVSNNTPVDIYIGGKEHAVLHLYYARFMSYFLHSLGWTPNKEPFKKLVVQGMVMGQSYRLKSTGKYIPAEQVEKVGKEHREKETGEAVVVQWEKMSKSKYNGENPERLLSAYGRDTTKLLMLADVPPATARRWSDATLPGVLNWQRRLWMTMSEFLKHRTNMPSTTLSPEEILNYEKKLADSRNYFIATATYHFKYTQKFSVGISRLQSLTSTLRNNIPSEIIAKSSEFEKAFAALIIMMAPVAPHFCSELWAGLQSAPHRTSETPSWIDWQKNVLEQSWPNVDTDFELSFLCKVDGADRSDIKIKASDLIGLSDEKALQIMLNEKQVKKMIKTDIVGTKFELFPECRAILYIFTRRKVKEIQAQENVN